MSASKVQANWASVSFNSASPTYDGVTSVKIEIGGQVLTFKADADVFDIIAASLTRQPTLSVTFADIALGMVQIPGTTGVFLATHNDAKLATGGAINYTITSAVFENCSTSGDHAAWGSATANYKTVTADGTTNPIGLARA